MSKMKPNNLKQALAEVEKFVESYGLEKDFSKKVPQEINETDKGCNIVILIKLNYNGATKKNEGYMTVQPLHKKQLEKLADKKVQSISYDKAIVLHEAEAVETVKPAPVTQEPAGNANQDNVLKEQLSEATQAIADKDAEIAELKKQLEKQNAGAEKEFNYKTAVKDDLIAYCLENGLELKGDEKVDDLRGIIEKYLELTQD